jgi:peptide/nickel transport system substrate-binding protein
VVDPHTVKIFLKHPYPPILDSLTTVWRPALAAGKDLNTAEFNMKPVGTGPFMYANGKRVSISCLRPIRIFTGVSRRWIR